MYRNLVTIHPDKNFGQYSEILVDGRPQGISCHQGCVIPLPGSGGFTLEARNVWGGTAAKNFTVGYAPTAAFHYNLSMPALALVVGLAAYATLRRYRATIAGALGFSVD